jgi:predicted DNA binding CopG/RHH family protein
MKKRSTGSSSRAKDRQVEEFDERDLGEDVRASRVRPVVVRAKARPTSIVLEPELIERLRKVGAKRGLGYQTMLKVIVREHLDDY